MKDVLVVIDMQNDFINGSLGTKEAEGIVENVKAKVDEYLKAGKRVYFTQDTHGEDYLDTFEGKNLPVEHCIDGSLGWAISDELPYKNLLCTVIEKGTFGYLKWDFSGVDTIEICGLCTDVCVVSNALILRAMYPQKQITLDSKCCAGVTPEKHEAALEVMKSCQIEVL